jgi:hypothetical protein
MTPGAKELVRAGREALRPSDADRERVLGALLPRLGSGLASAGAGGPTAPTATAISPVVKALGAVVGLGVVGGGLWLALRSAPPPPQMSVPTAAEAPSAAPVTAMEPPRSPASAAPAVEASARPPASVAVRPADSLAEEVAILSRAGAELHGGRPAAALTTLAEHQRRFPRGVLAQERTAARIQALCALGRNAEANAELERLARTSPNSPLNARARKACAPAPKQ